MQKRPLKFLWLSFSAGLVAIFMFLTSELRESQAGAIESIATIDHAILQQMTTRRSERMNLFAEWVTCLGSVGFLTSLVLGLGAYLFYKKKHVNGLQLLVAGSGAAAMTYGLKMYFARPRPEAMFGVLEEHGYSYPSGHSLSGSAIYLTIALILSEQMTKYKRPLVLMAFLFIILMVAFSRVYLGVHYFSDVAAGMLLGIAWATFLESMSLILQTNTALEQQN